MNALDLTQLGRYRVLELLGRGAMGVVHKAEDPSLGRTVAIKAVELSADKTDAANYEKRFYQEAKAAGGLNHPGIITIFDAGREGNWAYIAMELLEGRELRELLSEGRMPLSDVLDIAAQVAEALDYAHERGVVHRDIKPSNIMIVQGRRAKIMDFGIARMRVSAVETQVGMVLGSPKYMSPEQVVGQRVDHRSDIFSLGVMLFEMAVGMSPFSGKDVPDLMYAVVNNEAPRASQLNPAVPDMLDLILAKALQKDRELRYGNAGEMANDLLECRARFESQPSPAPVAREAGDATAPGVSTAPLAATTVPLAAPPGESSATLLMAGAATGEAKTPAEPQAPVESAIAMSAEKTIAARYLFSRRFDSSKAIARLSDPTAEDRERLSKPVGSQASPADRHRAFAAIAIAVSLIVAIVIAVV
jgi:eukaryotic-like serine/threonine-protein kinase